MGTHEETANNADDANALTTALQTLRYHLDALNALTHTNLANAQLTRMATKQNQHVLTVKASTQRTMHDYAQHLKNNLR